MSDDKLREKLLFRLQEWKSEGFDTSPIEVVINKEPDIRKVKRTFNDFKDKIRAIKDMELDLLLMDTTGFEEKEDYLKSNLKDITMFEEIKEEFEALKERVRAKEVAHRKETLVKDERKALMDKFTDWRTKGYEVRKYEKALRSEKDMARFKRIIEGLEKKIEVLEKVRGLVDGLKDEGYEGDVRRIERMVRQMDKLDLIWKEVYTLREKIQKRRKEAAKVDAASKPVKIKVKKVIQKVKVEVPAKPAKPKVKPRPKPKVKPKLKPKKEPEVEVLQFRRIDLYVQMLQKVIMANKRLLTLDTLRMAQRALKKDHPKIMFFLIQKDFKIKSMMPDHPDSYRALETYMNRLYSNMINLIGEVEAKERMRRPAKEYIVSHIHEILASGLDDYFPVFLIIDETDIPEEKAEVEEEEEDEMERIGARVKEWQEQGYKIDRLVQCVEGEGGMELVSALYRKTEEEIFWLKELEKDVEALEQKKGLEEECEKIRKKLKYPERISEIEDDILSLQMLQDVGGKLEDEDLI
jgi:hypothetical protein